MQNDTNKKWYFNRNGKLEEVPVEPWAWGVIYKDNTELHQFDAQGVFHQIGEVDQSRVKVFVLYKTGPENKRLDILVPEGAVLIHKYRNFVFNAAAIGGGEKPAEHRVRIYIIGIKHKGQTLLNYVLPGDHIIQSTEELQQLTQFGLAAQQ